jgi:hypothetical protein
MSTATTTAPVCVPRAPSGAVLAVRDVLHMTWRNLLTILAWTVGTLIVFVPLSVHRYRTGGAG